MPGPTTAVRWVDLKLTAIKVYAVHQAPGGETALTEHYFYPNGPTAQEALDAKWQKLTGSDVQASGPAELTVMFGRRLQVCARSMTHATGCSKKETHAVQ